MVSTGVVSALRDTVAAANGIQDETMMSPEADAREEEGAGSDRKNPSVADWTPCKSNRFQPEDFLSPVPDIGTPIPAWELGATPTAGNRSATKISRHKDPRVLLRAAARSLPMLPAIYQRGNQKGPEIAKELGVTVLDWAAVYKLRAVSGMQRRLIGMEPTVEKRAEPDAVAVARHNAQKVTKIIKAKGHGNGRTFTSKYRGVHQTFPTKRWEAQFRRNGKPTSLGCFDHEEEASRAYDKMILWVDLHATSAGTKPGITNFDRSEYVLEMSYLQNITQDELVSALRGQGRRQAAKRMMRHKRHDSQPRSGDDCDSE